MRRELIERLAPRLAELGRGSYHRAYRTRQGRAHPSSVSILLGEILDSLSLDYKEGISPLPGSHLVADFAVGDTLFFTDSAPEGKEVRKLKQMGKACILLSRERERSDRLDTGLRVIRLGEGGDGRLQTIFLDDPSFNFDYAHILPRTKKCSVMHGHTSSALVEIIGKPVEGMVVDFGAAKDVIREAIRSLDHKLFINGKYVVGEDEKTVTLSFETVHGEFQIRAPRATTVMLSGEATVENLAREVLSRITPEMPANVTAVGVYVYEGMNKGSHLLAQLHNSGAGNQRKKR